MNDYIKIRTALDQAMKCLDEHRVGGERMFLMSDVLYEYALEQGMIKHVGGHPYIFGTVKVVFMNDSKYA